MTNNTVKGTKKSAFTGSTTIPNGSYLDFVVNGQNLRIKDTDFYAALAVTGSIVQEGDPSGTPMLDKQGSVNAIRNITAGFGISSTINAYNGVTLSTSSTFDETGATLVDDITASSPVWRSVVAGEGVTVTAGAGTIEIATKSAAVTNSIDVFTISDFPPAVSGVITLEENTNYVILDDITTANRFVFQDNSTMQGRNKANIVVTYTGSDNFFSWSDANVTIERMTIVAASGSVLSGVNATASTYVTIFDKLAFVADDLGVIGETKGISISYCEFSLASDGVAFSGDLGNVLVTACDADIQGGTLFDMDGATCDGIAFANVFAGGDVSATFLDGAAASGNFNAGGLGSIVDCRIKSITPLAANITVDDVSWEFVFNDTIQDTKPNGILSLQGNSTETVIAGAGTAVKVAGTWVVEDVSQSTGTTDGRYTYDGIKPAKQVLTGSVSVAPASGGAVTMSAYFALNGTIISGSKRQGSAASGGLSSITMPWYITTQPGDYIELFVANEDSTVNIVVSSGVLRVS